MPKFSRFPLAKQTKQPNSSFRTSNVPGRLMDFATSSAKLKTNEVDTEQRSSPEGEEFDSCSEWNAQREQHKVLHLSSILCQ
ncbi:hypothetical protein L596_006442 [Steinernema carpocapsae]|uniref:Uncharacterized protein n=1 Tax=Steinernema carpocapsae TaxID=34508 RepID=A0A4U8V4D0_STECR|nr:hypothetical protein L596_006442 [Steinernema carpocapsae]